MKIATRLGITFAAITLLGFGIAVYSSRQMQQLSAQVDFLAEDRIPKIDLANQIKDDLNNDGRFARNIIIQADPKFRANEHENLKKSREHADAIFEKLDGMIKLASAREALDRLVEKRKAYDGLIDEVIGMAEAGKTNDEIAAVLTTTLRARQTEMFDAVDDLIKVQIDLSKQDAEASIATASTTSTALLVLAGLMAVVGVGATLVVTRQITGALGAEPDEVNDIVRRVSKGDLTATVAVRQGDTSSVMASVSTMQHALVDTVSTVRRNSEMVASASSQIAQGNQDLASRTEEQASALQQTSATMTELSTAVRSTSENAQQANQLASSATQAATKGGEIMGQVVTTMRGINDSSRKIADIITVIDGIAFQTNILALNAAVEAARAGEHGRGFAVVAGEVGNLASRSAEAAKEIKTLITSSVEQVERGTALVDRAGESMQGIVTSVQRVSDLVGAISAASAEQSTGVGQVETAVSQMDQATQQNAALVEESAAAADSLKGQAQELVHAVSFFTLNDAKNR